MKKIAIIQARMGASRLPGKVLKLLGDKPALEWVTTAANKIPGLDSICVATSDSVQDDAIAQWCVANNINCFRGAEHNVLSRYYAAAKSLQADVVMRITADCPFLDPYVAGQVLSQVTYGGADYASNVMPATWPDGLDCEAFTFAALEYAEQHASKKSDLEHVTPYITSNAAKFKLLNLNCPVAKLYRHRWTLDTPEDLRFLDAIASNLTVTTPTYVDILAVASELPDDLTPQHSRNEGFIRSLQDEAVTNDNFQASNEMLQRALQTIPLGSQTFSKSSMQYPKDVAPLFLSRGLGSRVWDVDGNEYVDLVSALLPNILGYADPDVNYTIEQQLSKGVTLSLATELECQLAEKLCAIIPSAEKVRFGKNGTDVTSAAIRLARAYTGREHIITCGYHGWQDWYVAATTRNKGVPSAVSELTHTMPYNDLNALETLLLQHDIAALIMEPCNTVPPHDGYLQQVKTLCEQHGAVLIFDEIITGFRFSMGGAQKYFNVTPHLSCFGKAMANGMPLSAIVGRADIMAEMEQIFFSGTFGGETLSLAAALATIEKMQQENVIEYLWDFGEKLNSEIQILLKQNNLTEIIVLTGYSPWKVLQFNDYKNIKSAAIRTLFLQEMLKNGVLTLGANSICYAHDAAEYSNILSAYSRTLSTMAEVLSNNNITEHLSGAPIEPVFKVR